MSYKSKREQVTNLLVNVMDTVDRMDRAEFDLIALQQCGASPGTIEGVLEVFAKAGRIKVTNSTIEKIKKPKEEKK